MSQFITSISDPTVENRTRKALGPAMIARADFLFITCSAVIIAAIALPLPENISGLLDAGWIVTVCLSAAIMLLALGAKNLSELSGFASFVISITLIKLGLAAASVKSILLHQSAGSFIEKTGSLLILDNLSLYAVVLPVAVLACTVFIFMTTGSIIKQTSKYATDTLPFKYISAEADLNASVITPLQAEKIKNRISTEAKFYSSMSVSGKFLRFDAVMNVLIIGLATLSVLKSHTSNTINPIAVQDGSVEVSLKLTIGLWTVVFLPAVILALSGCKVAGRNNLNFQKTAPSTKTGESENQAAQNCIIDESFELLNPDFTDISGTVENARRLDITENISENYDKIIETSDDSIIDQAFEGDDMYAHIAELVIDECEKKPAAALLCSESIELLPVTTAVKIAVELTDRGKKCLLIDADTTRDAVSKVFDINPTELTSPTETCVDNLFVWSVSKQSKTIGSDLAEKISKVVNDYDCIMIYAPKIEDSHYFGKLAGLVSIAGFATGNIDSDEKYILQLKSLLASVDCKCIVRNTLA